MSSMTSILYLAIQDKFRPPAEPTTSFAGKNIIVTGSNTGVGFEAAVKFTALGAARTILAVRSPEKGSQAKAEIESRTGKHGVVEVWQLDMSSYASIQAFAARAADELDHLDVAVLNAGVMHMTYETLSYGWERTLQVNFLSTTLLALLLLPKLRASKTATSTPALELVDSVTIAGAKMTAEEKAALSKLDVFNEPGKYDMAVQYQRSKLLLQAAVQHLATLVPPTDVVINTVCPGATYSSIARDMMGNAVARFAIQAMMVLFFRRVDVGARAYVSGVTQGPKVHGHMWKDDRVQPDALLLAGAEGDELQKQAWFEAVDALRKDVPEVVELAKF